MQLNANVAFCLLDMPIAKCLLTRLPPILGDNVTMLRFQLLSHPRVDQKNPILLLEGRISISTCLYWLQNPHWLLIFLAYSVRLSSYS